MRTVFRLVLACAVATSAIAASAALPPQYQRLAELRAVLALPDVARAGGAMQPIDRIEYVGPDLYRVTGGHCRIDVRIVDLPMPPGMVGPRRFEARAARPVCAR